MAMSQLIINNWLNWGSLAKTWATRRSYFDDGRIYPIPLHLQALKEQLRDAGAGSVPDWVTDLRIIARDERALVVSLPSNSAIIAAETYLRSGRSYPLPPFYNQVFGDSRTFRDVDGAVAFHTMRVGEHIANDFG